MWELVPKNDRPDAQVLLTLPNGERETIDGFLYQEFRETGPVEHPIRGGTPLLGVKTTPAGGPRSDRKDGIEWGPLSQPESGRRALTPAGPPHTRYRYLPRLAGTHVWQHRTPIGGFLEQGAFVVEREEAREGAGAGAPSHLRLTATPRLADPGPPPFVLALPGDEDVAGGLGRIERDLENASRERGGVLVPLDFGSGGVLLVDGAPDLARCWVLDRVLRAAAARGVAVVLGLAPAADLDAALFHAALHFLVCRYAPMAAVAAWEVEDSGEAAEATSGFLRAFDPRHPVLRAR